MWKMLLNLLIDFLLSLTKNETIKEKEKIEIISTPSPMIEPVSNGTIVPVENTQLLFKPLIIENYLPESQYCREVTDKDMIVLHHTVGGDSSSSYAYWLGNKEKVATHFLVDRNGTVTKCFDEKYWAYHLYVASPGNRITKSHKRLGSEYDRRSIGIELCNLGQVTLRDGVFYDLYKRAVHPDKVIKIKSYKGYEYWEKYTDAQLKAIEYLILTLCDKYPKIKEKAKLQTDYSGISEISQDALEFRKGIVGHANLRTDKYDTAPQPQLIEMLNQLHTKL